MLELESVTKHLNTFCLKNLSLSLPAGYIMGLIGENGAGKTTLIRLIAGLYSADQGSIRLNGMEYGESEEAVKQEIGVVLHGELFDANAALIQNARRYGRFYRRYDEALLEEYLYRFGLAEKQKYGRLSKGEKLKFALAFALSHKPGLLL
ncbi:MAG: ATP-binding cassette domain-containing protein, partial [Lachnospiraceae bacterium]|nr:ATP-binding cassette domain-containing protein [Lachnospiraceae bacterium]